MHNPDTDPYSLLSCRVLETIPMNHVLTLTNLIKRMNKLSFRNFVNIIIKQIISCQ